jgi:hypothetical protein
VKSTIATSASSAPSVNRWSTSFTWAHSRSPAVRSTPACSQISYACRAVFACSTREDVPSSYAAITSSGTLLRV